MTTAALAARILADTTALEALVAPLDDVAVSELVEHFKSEADRHWFINANRSLEFAELIIGIGRQRSDLRHIALGTMARGDALKLLGQLQEAWDELERAGNMFMDAGDEVGWARTRIGKVFICVDLERVSEALADAEEAWTIFEQYNAHQKRLVLALNLASVYNLLGNQSKALELYNSAIELALSLGDDGDQWLGSLYDNIGNVYRLLGDLNLALKYHQRAHDTFSLRDEISACAIAKLNIAYLLLALGNYRKALTIFYQVRDIYNKEDLLLDANDVNRDIVECYLALNRYTDAHGLALHVVGFYQSAGAVYGEGITLLYLAEAEANLGILDAAQATCNAAEQIFKSLRANTWVAATQMRRGKIMLHRNMFDIAQQEAAQAAANFASYGQRVQYADAILLYAQALLAVSNSKAVIAAGKEVLIIAQRTNVPTLRYNAHLLLGRMAEDQGRFTHACRRYNAAISTVERVQRDLTITLRHSFLADKNEASHALIALYLRTSCAKQSFETLERAKSHALLGYLANRENLRWPGDDLQVQALVVELNQLRAEHHWFYRLAHDQQHSDDEPRSAVLPEQARAEVIAREKRMRAITEQLYLYSDGLGQTKPPKLHDVQAALDDNSLLVEFYNDGAALWVYTLDQHDIQVQRLTTMPTDVDRLIEQLQRNISFALDVGTADLALRGLVMVAQRILQRLYAALLAPIEAQFVGRQRLIVVPYGALHYLPFHLLHNGAAHLIERHEIVILPAAGLLTRPGPTRPAGARVFAHSWEGRLPLTRSEAQTVEEFFDSDVYMEEEARRDALGGTPEQILHIAAHGQHRLDQPDLSFIQLADGQLYTDDLLQHDLSYELVVLSACETGRANVAAGDELIGLGRGFLYAGAGALIASLWRVADATTLVLMAKLYQQLSAGVSKAAALRAAQLALLAEHPGMHPAFWGAFQLVGDARPLTGLADGTQMGADLWTQMNADLHHHNAEYA